MVLRRIHGGNDMPSQKLNRKQRKRLFRRYALTAELADMPYRIFYQLTDTAADS